MFSLGTKAHVRISKPDDWRHDRQAQLPARYLKPSLEIHHLISAEFCFSFSLVALSGYIRSGSRRLGRGLSGPGRVVSKQTLPQRHEARSVACMST
jgi:hypothetical protein